MDRLDRLWTGWYFLQPYSCKGLGRLDRLDSFFHKGYIYVCACNETCPTCPTCPSSSSTKGCREIEPVHNLSATCPKPVQNPKTCPNWQKKSAKSAKKLPCIRLKNLWEPLGGVKRFFAFFLCLFCWWILCRSIAAGAVEVFRCCKI